MASEYVCDFGYGIRGNTSVRTCVAEGTGIYGDWNGTAPTCEAIFCNALRDLLGATRYSLPNDGGRYPFGTVATYSCGVGSAIVGGPVNRTCIGDGSSTLGSFDGTQSMCEEYMCPDLPDPTNGRVTFASDTVSPFNLSTTATYSCDQGFGLNGNPTRTCSSNVDNTNPEGLWSGVTPTCDSITCAPLTDITNGMLISYDSPPDASGDYPFETVASFSCLTGFGLSGATFAACSGNGSSPFGAFDSVAPTCESILCDPLENLLEPTIYNLPIQEGRYPFGTVATYSCGIRSAIVGGSVSRSCVGDGNSTLGSFNGTEPICEEYMCSDLPDPVNGRVTFAPDTLAPFRLDTIATYDCDIGFGLSGAHERTCDSTDSTPTWSGDVPLCESIQCYQLDPLKNGTVVYSGSNYSFGDTATYSCDIGFGLSGNTEQICGGNGSSPKGEWSGTDPSCEEILCVTLEAPSNGLIVYTEDVTIDVDHGTTATYVCNEGYGLTGGDAVRTCSGGGESQVGEWSGSSPSCDNIYCPPLFDPDNGRVVFSTTATTNGVDYGSTATFSCNNEYGLTSKVVLICGGDGTSQNGTWSSDPPSCQGIRCQDIPDPANGQIHFVPDQTAPFNFGTLATFSCDPGYGLDWEAKRQCGGNGNSTDGVWSDSSPTCSLITCPLLKNLKNGTIVYSSEQESRFDIGTVATYICDQGYVLNGTTLRACMEDDRIDTVGEWSRDAPTCLEITCPILAIILNGGILYNSEREDDFEITTSATYFCSPGYALVGDITRTCMDDNHLDTIGVWNGTAPTCASIQCLPLSSIDNGEITYSGDTAINYDLGTVAAFSCSVGYTLVGNHTRLCLDDDQADTIGTWSGKNPSCETIICPSLGTLENGHIAYSEDSFEIETVATYTCDVGFVLIGDSTRVCIDDDQMDTIGIWNSTSSYCERIKCDLLILDHGQITYSSVGEPYGYGTVATFACNKDFELVGSSNRTCAGDGSDVQGYWTGVLAYCDAGECVYDSIIPIVDVTTFPGYRQLSTGTEDPSSPPINIPDGVVFGDKVVNIAYVNENGAISFEQEWKFAYPGRFPTDSEQTMQGLVVAPFWSDNDIRKEGSVRYATYSVDDSANNPVGAELMKTVNSYIRTLEVEDFHGRWLLVAHWNGVHPSPHGSDNTSSIPQEQLNQVNNYQAIVVSGIVRAYAIFTYFCGGIQWSSVGQNNLAVVGFNAGTSSDNVESFFKNYRLSGLEGVGGNVSCEVKTSNITNLIIRLPATEFVEQSNKLNCILALQEDTAILGGETTHAQLSEMLDHCPCTREQAVEDNARFIPQLCPNMMVFDCFISASPKMLEILSTNMTLMVTQQCCYQTIEPKALITSTSDLSAGTMILHHPHRDPENYNLYDKNLKDICCSNGYCGKFYQQRPINNCNGYTGIQNSEGSGDPHYWTFDGRYHTFNGKGDFTILEIKSADGVTPEFSIQGRLATVRRWSITTHQGIAFGNENLAFHVATSASAPNGYRVYQTRPAPMREITNELHNGPCEAWSDYSNDAMIKNLGREIFLSFFQSGVSARIEANSAGSNEHYLNLYVKVPHSLGLRVSGFLGSPDDNEVNDLFARNQATPLPLHYKDDQLFPHMMTWMVDDGKSLFFEGVVGRQKRESWSSQNSSNDSDTTQQPTDFPTTIEPTNPEPEEEFIPIFFNQLNFTDHQIMLCEGNNQCLFDFAVTGEEEFAMETLASNKKAQETRDILNNFPPNITASASFRVYLREYSVFSLYVADPGDNFTLELNEGLPINSSLTDNGDGYYIFIWNLFEITGRTLEFIANDTRGAASVFIPRVEICLCKNGGICTMDGVITDDATVVMNCLCSAAYTGRYCEEDHDGCTEFQCFEGVECIDIPAPGVGAECGPCPQGFTGDSQKCYDVDECSLNETCSQMCINTRGSFSCACYDGYQLVEGSNQCEDINECEGFNDCQQLCENTEGSYTCSCSEGFTLNSDNRTCIAIQPCEGNCSFGCAVINGTQHCYCPTGFELSTQNQTICNDIDECLSATSPCEQLCNNTEGSFLCECRGGYRLQSNRRCEDINECFEAALRDEELCETNSQCINTEGSFECRCVPGFVIMNNMCQPIICLEVADIVNGSVSYETDTTAPFELSTRAIYSCNMGFAHFGVTTRICKANSSNPVGLWTESPPVCVDIDECSESSDKALCGVNSHCINTVGSYDCVCAAGYALVNGDCELNTTSLPPVLVLPEAKAIGAIEVTLNGFTNTQFNEDLQQRFKEITALNINKYCLESLQMCHLSEVIKRTRRQGALMVTADDIILTDFKDSAEGILTFLMIVQVRNKVLIASDLQQAVQSGTEAYASAQFSNISSQLFVATTTSPPTPVALTTGVAVGVSVGAALILLLVFVPIVCIFCCGKRRGRVKQSVDEISAAAIEYRNPLAEQFEEAEKEKEVNGKETEALEVDGAGPGKNFPEPS